MLLTVRDQQEPERALRAAAEALPIRAVLLPDQLGVARIHTRLSRDEARIDPTSIVGPR